MSCCFVGGGLQDVLKICLRRARRSGRGRRALILETPTVNKLGGRKTASYYVPKGVDASGWHVYLAE